MLSAKILRELWVDHADADKSIKQMVCTIDTVFSESSPSLAQLFFTDNMHQISFLCMLSNVARHLLTVQE